MDGRVQSQNQANNQQIKGEVMFEDTMHYTAIDNLLKIHELLVASCLPCRTALYYSSTSRASVPFRKIMMAKQRNLHQAWILFSCISWLSLPVYSSSSTRPATATASTAAPASLDLSYKHYLDASLLEEAIRASFWDDLEDSIEQIPLVLPESIELDVSNSILGDEAKIKAVLRALLPKDHTKNNVEVAAVDRNKNHAVGIAFVSRNNRLTPKAMDDLFQILLNNSSTGSTNQTTAGENEKDNATTTQSSNNDTDSGTINSRQPLWKVDTLDVGWNELHPLSAGWKNFLKSLQRLLQTPQACPETIRLDRCGLGPGACRAIGKVRTFNICSHTNIK